jgi:hypothetical protein
MFHLWGVGAGQLSLVSSNPQYLEYLIERYPAGVYVHWNFWCNVQEPVQPAFCWKALQLRPIELAREHHERDQRYAFYRLPSQVTLDLSNTPADNPPATAKRRK